VKGKKAGGAWREVTLFVVCGWVRYDRVDGRDGPGSDREPHTDYEVIDWSEARVGMKRRCDRERLDLHEIRVLKHGKLHYPIPDPLECDKNRSHHEYMTRHGILQLVNKQRDKVPGTRRSS